jgi:hypothetical protein
MLVNHNLKIYRIPEILFYYRVKDATESRNIQANKYEKDIRKLLKRKYPSYACIQLISDISRFFWQKKITKSNKLIVKVCRIIVYSKKLKKGK